MVAEIGGSTPIAPITTELQRLGKSRADADARVLLRLRDNQPLNVDFLRDTLTAWPRAGVGKVCFSVTCVGLENLRNVLPMLMREKVWIGHMGFASSVVPSSAIFGKK